MTASRCVRPPTSPGNRPSASLSSWPSSGSRALQRPPTIRPTGGDGQVPRVLRLAGEHIDVRGRPRMVREALLLLRRVPARYWESSGSKPTPPRSHSSGMPRTLRSWQQRRRRRWMPSTRSSSRTSCRIQWSGGRSRPPGRRDSRPVRRPSRRGQGRTERWRPGSRGRVQMAGTDDRVKALKELVCAGPRGSRERARG